MATFRGSGTLDPESGTSFPSDTDLQAAVDEANAAVAAAKAHADAAEVSVALAEVAQGLAEDAATSALGTEALAAAQVVLAEAQVALADAAAAAAAASEAAAAASESTASTAATDAETAETGAQAAQTAAEASFDSFDDKYLGSKLSDPTTDNDGDPLVRGALYWFGPDDGEGELMAYDGILWNTVGPIESSFWDYENMKFSDESKLNDATRGVDSDFTLALAADTTYEIEWVISFNQSAPDVGAGPDMSTDILYSGTLPDTGEPILNLEVSGQTQTLQVRPTSWFENFNVTEDRKMMVIRGIVDTTTAGDLTLGWSQRVAHASISTTVHRGSLARSRVL